MEKKKRKSPKKVVRHRLAQCTEKEMKILKWFMDNCAATHKQILFEAGLSKSDYYTNINRHGTIPKYAYIRLIKRAKANMPKHSLWQKTNPIEYNVRTIKDVEAIIDRQDAEKLNKKR